MTAAAPARAAVLPSAPAPAAVLPSAVDLTKHLRLCHSVARKYRHLCCAGLEYDDLFQAAFEGMTFASQHYDESKSKFSTFAYPMARFFVLRVLRQGRTAVRAPLANPLAVREVSLNAPAVPGGLEPALDRLPATTAAPDEDAAENQRRRAVRRALLRLPDRARTIVLARMRGETLREIAVRLRLSPERARQIERSAHETLRRSLAHYGTELES